VSIRSFGAQQTTAGGLPQAVTSIQTGSLGSFPLALNQPVFLPMPPDEARITYVTVPGIRGKSLELFVDGPAKVFASDEEHGFILDIGTAASVGSGSAGVFTTLGADNDHDQLLLTIESPSTPDPSTLILSVNDNVTVHNLKIRFLGRASDFSRTDEELITTLDDILERASRMIYSVTQGHARLGEAEVVIGRFAQPGFHETMSISPVALPGAPEAFVTLPRVIHANREWWQLPVEDAALVLTHEFFHSAYLLPDEYHDGFPDLINGPHRTAQSTCGSSIMGVRELLELCVAATHGSTPRPTQQHTSMWELLAPQLTNVPVPVHSTTEFARGLSTMKLPVNTH
jgi:hypothetical protein